MTAQRLLGFPTLLCVAACASNGGNPRTTLAPHSGPRAHIYASYDAGPNSRTLRASFRVDSKAYVMVGHLGGNGRIEILYPENAMAYGRVQGNKTYSVGPVSARYDAVPQLFSFASRAYRSTGARMNSYDGLGNGYVFLIASFYPLDFAGLLTDGFWDEYEVEDYGWSSDPRYAIRDLADHVARGLPYTLDYADNFGTNAFTNYANVQMDCSDLSSTMGLWGSGGTFIPSLGWWYGGALMQTWWYLSQPTFFTNGYTSLNADCYGRQRYGSWAYSPPYPQAPVTPRLQPNTPDTLSAPTPLAPRMGGRVPGLRTGSESGAAVSLTRPRFGGSPTTTTTTSPSWEPPVPRQREPERFRPSGPTSSAPRTSYDPPSQPSQPSQPREHEAPASSSGRYDSPRVAPVSQAPHFSPPPPPPAPSAPAASGPASPPPKVEAASAGKPRQP